MHRTIQMKLRSWRWWGEQAAHIAIGGVIAAGISAIVFAIPSQVALIAVVAQFAGSTAGVVREILQNWGDDFCDNDTVDSNFDSLAFTIGAALIAIPVAVFA